MTRLSPDWVFLFITLILVAIGSVMVYSSSAVMADFKFKSQLFFFQKQLFWIAISLIFFIVTIKTDYHRLKFLSLPLVLISLLFLVLVLFAPLTKGVHRWIRLGPFGFQPTELFRYSLVLFLASSLAKRQEKIKQFKYFFFPYFPLLAIAFLLILKEPHLGAILIIGASTFLLLFVAGAKIRYMLMVVMPVFLIGLILVFGKGYNQNRISDYLASFLNPLNGSYHVKQSVLSLGNGGLTGVGLGEGRQKLFFLPEPHTDFILATIGEEGGFIWISGILVLFLAFAWRGFAISLRAPDLFGFYLGLGLVASIFIGALVNIGVVTGVLPTTGIPLPFISYGGSSVFMALCACGVVLNISSQRVKKYSLNQW